MIDTAFCKVKKTKVSKKTCHFYEWSAFNVIFVPIREQLPSSTVTSKSQLVKEKIKFLASSATAVSFQRLQTLRRYTFSFSQPALLAY